MNTYPNIMGIHLDMSLNELEEVTKNLNCNPLSKFDEYNDKIEDDTLYFYFHDNHLDEVIIKDWREFFTFTSDISFKNLLDVFSYYFLKGYKYEIITTKSTIEYYADEWILEFDTSDEEITMSKNFYDD